MSSVSSLIKQIRALPYADMMMVAEEVRDRIKDLTQHKIEAIVLADILARLQPGTIDLSESTREEEKVLKDIFRRKYSLTIQRHGNGGWAVDIPAVPGAHVVSTELRQAFPMMLDQVITLHVLTKK